MTTRNGRKILLNTPEEDAAITAAAESDPDARPMTDEEWEAAKPTACLGRPRAEQRKVSTTIRFDADVLAAMKATGPGWQTRINDIVREYVKTRTG
ncbi:BrnA antitoxin family protein [Imhoffiella purpurea]|uniref:BrnA antitoxin family protein n=1 Tax=Imhoffiella purpurea TaxID=1249627 RepID=UPI0018DF4EAD|nr:BrnA antitoxin family protein [Imhoffiella purpurea]